MPVCHKLYNWTYICKSFFRFDLQVSHVKDMQVSTLQVVEQYLV